MNTEVYWFSGTGNSLASARTIAGETGGNLRSLARAESQDRISSSAGRLVVVFPCYLQALVGYPLAVERFFTRLEDIAGKEIHAVCTCGGHEAVNALPALRNLDRLIRSRGGKLRSRHSVRLPMNNLDYEHIPFPLDRDQEKMHSLAARKLPAIAHRINQGRKEKSFLASSLLYLLVRPLMSVLKGPILKTMIPLAREAEPGTGHKAEPEVDRQFREIREDGQVPAAGCDVRDILYHTDRSIRVGSACNSCGTCVRVCPASNIRHTGGDPEFLHRCEMCFACDEWCPQAAIQHWGRASGIKYRHPQVSLKDMTGGE